MKINVHSIHFDADKKLIEFINEKVVKLAGIHDQITVGEVYLRLEKSSANDNKIAEIKLHVPGKELFAKRQCKSFEEAVDLSVDALRNQIKKYKGKLVK
ncbi:MAG: HPF/RaiA family ribosome-associated protein [Bacteroidota bacterium]